MILASMNLFYETTDARRVAPDEHEEVLAVKAHVLIARDDLNVREALLVRAHLVLALHDHAASGPDHAPSLESRT